jgi:hypothetical protein
VLLVVALTLLGLLSIVAIALDGGLLLSERRHAQAVADAAALAAASDLYVNYAANQGLDPNGTAQAIALSYAAANGYTNDGVQSVITVNIPPKSGDYTGRAGYAEVIVQFNQPRYFSGVFSAGTLPVRARAVGWGNPGNVGILILDPSISDSCEIDGNVNILSGGQIWVNSTDSQACQVATTANLTCGGLNIVGGLRNSGAITYTDSGGLSTGVAPKSDPLAGIPEPGLQSPDYGSVTCSGNYTLFPGLYNQISVSAGASVTLMPGIYQLGTSSSPGNGITLQGGATLTGSGVMFYSWAGDKINFKNAGVINITPPTSGTYRGISVFLPRSAVHEVHIESPSNLTMPGTWYAQAGEFDIRPDGASTVFNIGNYICDQAEWGQGYSSSGKSNGIINMNPATAAPTQRPILVE